MIVVTRGRWIAIVVVAVLAVLLAVAAPAVLRAKATSAIEGRSGCRASVGAARPGIREVLLEDVHLTCAFGTVHLHRVRADVDWLALAPRAVRVEGGSAILAARPSRAGSGTAGATERAPAVAMPVSVTGLAVSLVDGSAPWMEATVAVEGGTTSSWTLTATALRTSAELHPVVVATEVRLVVDGGERLIDTLEVHGLEVSAHAGPALIETVRSWAHEEPRSVGGHPSSGAAARERWEWLREGGSVRVDGGTIRDEEGEALSDLEVELARVRGASFRLRGRGHPRGTGDASWDLEVDAADTRVDGPIRLDDVPLSVFVPFLPSLPLHDPSRARVSSDARVRTSDGGVVEFDGRFAIEGLALQSGRIASAPVLGIAFEVEGRGRWHRLEHSVELERGTLTMAGARATIVGRGSMVEDRFAFEVQAELPSTPCDVAVHAIPAGFLQELTQMHLEGRIAASLALSVDSERLDDTTLRFGVDDHCRFTAVPALADVMRFAGPFEHEVLEPDDRVFRMETGPGTSAWTPISEISPFLLHAVLAHEDASFFTHSGFAPWAIRDALVRNLRERRYVLGASTITMQLVKNVFLRREKTLARKVQEVLLTWWIESALTKPQILELYLNVIEYGPSVYGIRNAAAHYFGRSPGDLSVAEAAYLAMILPNPPGFHEQYDANEVPPAFRRRVGGFIGILEHRGRIDAEAAAQGREEMEIFAFSRGGERVGPEILRGGSAQLPIDGFSGYPAVGWAEEGSAETGQEPLDEENTDGEEDGWEEVWP